MTDQTTLLARWRLVPTTPPLPLRHCPGCARPRDFASSGRVRLNANAKRLDAWLIYKCLHCDQTWNRPLLERQPVGRIAPAELDAMQHSAPDWVRRHEFDIAGLKAQCTRIRAPSEVTIRKDPLGAWPRDWSQIRLRLTSEFPTGLRLDRVLCDGWQLSRSQLQKLTKERILTVRAAAKTPLRRPLQGTAVVEVRAKGLCPEMRSKLAAGLGEGPGP